MNRLKIRKIAGILNTGFVAIKVDREERPDIDSVYMTACQQMTGQGGWPLTIIMTPDKKPFFAGTYFPRSSRAGMTGLSEILEKVIRLWKDDRNSLAAAGAQITALLAKTPETTSGCTAGLSLLTDGYDELAASFDTLHGGFGRAPKFPVPSRILFLLRYWKRTGSARALRMAEETLEAMRCGGIYDHCGGGFPPVFNRCGVARPAFREDALRSGTSPHGLHGSMAGNKKIPVQGDC